MRTEALCQQKFCIFVKLFFAASPSIALIRLAGRFESPLPIYSLLRPEYHVGIEIPLNVRGGGQDAHAIGLASALPGHKVAGVDKA